MKVAHDIAAEALKADPLTLAIFFVGLMGLGVIWLALVAIKSNNRRK